MGAILAIKKGRAVLHQKFVYFAMACSLIFLISYVCYHFTTPATVYGDLDGNGLLSDLEREQAGYARIFYLVILLTHITGCDKLSIHTKLTLSGFNEPV